MGNTIFFSVGEPSGDQHAARLIAELPRTEPALQIRGFGGREMRESGCEIDLDLTEHAVVGLLEVLPKLRQFFRFADQAEALFQAGKVDAVILVDFPGFNWHIAKRAKRYGIPVFYYCPPQLWAWGSWRVKKMKAWVDHVLAVLPIEVEFYRSHGVPTTFVGHPFFDAVADQRLEQPILDQLEARRASGRTIAVLPGSRTHEVHSNWPIMLQSIQKIHQSHPQVRFAVAGYREKHVKFCRDSLDTLSAELPIDFYQGCTSEIIEHADLSMMVSGSVSLEMMARRTPSVVIYRVGRFLYAFGKCVIKVDSMTLPNLMPQESDQTVQHGDERVFPEIVSVGDTRRGIDFLTDVTRRLLDDQEYQSAKRLELDRLAKRYASPGASVRAASLIGQLLQRDTVGDTHQLENATQDHPRVSGSSR